MLRMHTFALLRDTHQQCLSAPVGIPLEPRIDAVVFYLPLFHLVGGGIGRVARYRLHGLVDTKEMGTDRTSAEIFLQGVGPLPDLIARSEEHTSELQSLMRISYAVFCLKKKTTELNFQHT